MATIEFNFNQKIIEIQANLDDTFQNVINKYLQKSLINPKSVTFFANGNIINLEKTVDSQMNMLNKKDNKMTVFVHLNNEEKKEIIEKSKVIICPECYEPCRIKFQNCKIKLYDCLNNHIIDNIKIKDFENTQKINNCKIICDQCKEKNKGQTFKNEFYKCLTCSNNLCPICKTKHDEKHIVIKYDQKNYICKKHNDAFIKYCTNCKLNICFLCESEHKKHNTIFFGDLMPNLGDTKKKLLELKSNIELLKDNITMVINQLHELIEIMNIYYEMNNEILVNYDMRNRNYEMLDNIKEITDNNNIFDNIKAINKIKNINEKVYNLMYLYNKINADKNLCNKDDAKNEKENNNNNNEDILNEMTLIYNIDKNTEKVNIFYKDFVNNNKNNCYIVMDGQKYELCNEFKLNKYKEEKNMLEIHLIEIRPITNMSCMFYKCNSLNSSSDFSSWDTRNVTNMSYMFGECGSLKSLPDISNFNTKNVTDISYMFTCCGSLLSLPDISNWDTENVINMSCMFNGCHSLKSLPDISNWDTENVIDMGCMFNGCLLLKSLPDISKWNYNKNPYTLFMFQGVDKNIIPQKTDGCFIY